MRELNGRLGRPMFWLWAVAAALAVSSLVVTACGSPADQAAVPTSTSTASPTAIEKQASAAPTHAPTLSPTAVEEQASAEPTHTPTSTPTPTASGERDSGSDPEATSTPTPTRTPTPASSQPVSDPEPPSTTTPAVTTTEVVAAEPPLGDCFEGVLSENPLHCYVLEQAQAEGLIDMLAFYDGDGPLYVSVERVDDGLLKFAVEQSFAFHDMWPLLLPYGVLEILDFTLPGSHRHCPLLYRGRTEGGVYRDGYHFLPPPQGYSALVLVLGGEAGLRKTMGWASWQQLWPRESEQGTTVRGSGGGPAFDVSDVDVTNFPEIDCGGSSICRQWTQFSDVGYAGAYGGAV